MSMDNERSIIVESDKDGVYQDVSLASDDQRPLKRFTLFVGEADENLRVPLDCEEIDVDALNKSHAEAMGKVILTPDEKGYCDYQPGLVIHQIEGPRVGFYM